MQTVRTIVCKLAPTPEQATEIDATLEAFAAACNHIATASRREGTTNKVILQHACYREVRETFGLSANLTIRAIARVCIALKVPEKVHSTFEATSIDYDQRIFAFRESDWTFSLTLLNSRERLASELGDWQRSALRGQYPTSATLVKHQDGGYFLHVQVTEETPEPDKIARDRNESAARLQNRERMGHMIHVLLPGERRVHDDAVPVARVGPHQGQEVAFLDGSKAATVDALDERRYVVWLEFDRVNVGMWPVPENDIDEGAAAGGWLKNLMPWIDFGQLDHARSETIWSFKELKLLAEIHHIAGEQRLIDEIRWIARENMAFRFAVPLPADQLQHLVDGFVSLPFELPGWQENGSIFNAAVR